MYPLNQKSIWKQAFKQLLTLQVYSSKLRKRPKTFCGIACDIDKPKDVLGFILDIFG